MTFLLSICLYNALLIDMKNAIRVDIDSFKILIADHYKSLDVRDDKIQDVQSLTSCHLYLHRYVCTFLLVIFFVPLLSPLTILSLVGWKSSSCEIPAVKPLKELPFFLLGGDEPMEKVIKPCRLPSFASSNEQWSG